MTSQSKWVAAPSTKVRDVGVNRETNSFRQMDSKRVYSYIRKQRRSSLQYLEVAQMEVLLQDVTGCYKKVMLQRNKEFGKVVQLHFT
jgi:hypothetical protein